jgi:hypothetical protein
MDEIFVSAKIANDLYDGKPFLFTIVEINGWPLVDFEHDDLGIDLVELVKTIDNDGEYYVITCTCGDAGCAGITKGIHVINKHGTFQWLIHNSSKDVEVDRNFTFNAEEYIAAIEHGLIQFLKLKEENPNIGTSPYLLRNRIEFAKDHPKGLLLFERLSGSGG